jgi:hypothetical protein
MRNVAAEVVLVVAVDEVVEWAKRSVAARWSLLP